MTNREKILHDCDEAAEALIASREFALRQAKDAMRQHDRDERNAWSMIVVAAVCAILGIVASVWFATGGAK